MDHNGTGNNSNWRLRMKTYIFLAESFMDICLLIIIFVFAPIFLKMLEKCGKKIEKAQLRANQLSKIKINSITIIYQKRKTLTT